MLLPSIYKKELHLLVQWDNKGAVEVMGEKMPLVKRILMKKGKVPARYMDFYSIYPIYQSEIPIILSNLHHVWDKVEKVDKKHGFYLYTTDNADPILNATIAGHKNIWEDSNYLFVSGEDIAHKQFYSTVKELVLDNYEIFINNFWEELYDHLMEGEWYSESPNTEFNGETIAFEKYLFTNQRVQELDSITKDIESKTALLPFHSREYLKFEIKRCRNRLEQIRDVPLSDKYVKALIEKKKIKSITSYQVNSSFIPLPFNKDYFLGRSRLFDIALDATIKQMESQKSQQKDSITQNASASNQYEQNETHQESEEQENTSEERRTNTYSQQLRERLEEYGFFDYLKNLGYENDQQENIFHLLSTNKLPYRIALLAHLQYVKHIQDEYCKTYKQRDQVLAYILNDVSSRKVRGNINVLNAKSGESRYYYTADQHWEVVKQDILKLGRESQSDQDSIASTG